MASTIPISRSITLASQSLRNAPLLFTGQNSDPAFSNGDWVKQTILSAPSGWRWNRVSATFSSPTFVTIAGQSDYEVSLPNFGWLEKSTAYDTNDGDAAFALKVELSLASATQSDQPISIAAYLDDGEGNITFRLSPAPDKVYAVVCEYQKAAVLFLSPTDTWEPIPDYLSNIYNIGFLAKSCEYMNDPRFAPSMQMFFQLLAQNFEGLTQSQRNEWLQDKLNYVRELQKAGQPG